MFEPKTNKETSKSPASPQRPLPSRSARSSSASHAAKVWAVLSRTSRSGPGQQTGERRGDLPDFSRAPKSPPGPAATPSRFAATTPPVSMPTLEGEADIVSDRPGPMAKTGGAGAGGAQPAPASPPGQGAAPAMPCQIITTTLAAAPSGAANSRDIVGVGEQVTMASPVSVRWTASRGTLSHRSGLTTIWTAPHVGATCTITAKPARGASCSVKMTVIAPVERALTWASDVGYTAGLAGSGFVASGAVMPLHVSFSRIEIREERAVAKATGYYDVVLRWNGIVHPQTPKWIPIDATNTGFTDTVGSPSPGTPGPFSPGKFIWPIPQSYRVRGRSGNGAVFSTGTHAQVMTNNRGTEGTAKEGASRGRSP